MTLIDYVTVSGIFTAIVTILGWLLKIRLDASVKHEYSRILETFKAEIKRTEVLGSERLEAFKAVSEKLIILRRYCQACSNEYGDASEFSRRPDTLPKNENTPLLQHHEAVFREAERFELFLSPKSRFAFEELKQQMGLGFSLETWLQSDNEQHELNADALYDSIINRVNVVMDCLYRDLGLPE